MLLKELQSLGLAVKVLKDDNTEVEIMETIDYGETDLHSIIEGDRRRDTEESYDRMGYTRQEFANGELVNVETEDEEEGDDTEDLGDPNQELAEDMEGMQITLDEE